MPTMAWYHTLAKYDWLPYLTLAAVCLTTLPLIRRQLRETIEIHDRHEWILGRVRDNKLLRTQHPEDAVPLEILQTLCQSPVYDIRVAAEKIVLDRFLRNPRLIDKLYTRLEKGEDEQFEADIEQLNFTLNARELASLPMRERDMELPWGVDVEEISPEENELLQRHVGSLPPRLDVIGDPANDITTPGEQLQRHEEEEGARRLAEIFAEQDGEANDDGEESRAARRARRETIVFGSLGGNGESSFILSHPDPEDPERARILTNASGQTFRMRDTSPNGEEGTDGVERTESDDETSAEAREILSQWVEGYDDDNNLQGEMHRPRYRVFNEEFEI